MKENITLRAIRPEDEPFLFAAYASTRAQEMAHVPWNDLQREAFLRHQFAAQQAHYRKHYPRAEHFIIELDGQPAGVSFLNEGEVELRIVDLIVVPEFRRQGIGSYLLKDNCTRAQALNKTVSVYVETFNPALELFTRLGFTKTAEDGINLFLEWLPQAGRTNTDAQEKSAP